MSNRVNEFGQPVGTSMASWAPPPPPPREPLAGRYCRLEPLSPARHLADLWDAQCQEPDGARWTYLPYGPFSSLQEYDEWCVASADARDPQFYAVVVDGRAVGVISFMRIDPSHGAIEVGHVYFSPRLAKTRAATEAVFLLAATAFELGYRRVEWKCDSLNLPSRKAATRLGFAFEGLFRQAAVYKGRSRDTTWFAITDKDWVRGLQAVFQRWLDPDNFDAHGQQKLKLSALTAPFAQATHTE